jgi:hypothetical protein
MPIEPLHAEAEDNLRFIREKMAHASRFTGVPGWGGVMMGVVAIVAAVLAARQADPRGWMIVWMLAALIAVLIGGWSMDRKARAAGAPMLWGKGRRFLLGLLPPLFAGAVLTAVLFAAGNYQAIPGVWLLLYGAAEVTGGAYSIRLIPVMGICFMLLGVAAFFVPLEWGNWLLALGFGGLQIGFGIAIGLRHGG